MEMLQKKSKEMVESVVVNDPLAFNVIKHKTKHHHSVTTDRRHSVTFSHNSVELLAGTFK